VIRACQAGDKATAIGIYLAYAIGEAHASKYSSPLEMMHDWTLVPVMNDCALFCWYHSHPHVLDTPDWCAYRDRVLGGSPITFDFAGRGLDALPGLSRRQARTATPGRSRRTGCARDGR
jgi:hypothetical protein